MVEGVHPRCGQGSSTRVVIIIVVVVVVITRMG